MTYQTISGPGRGAYRDRGSRFEAYLYPVDSPLAADSLLGDIRREHPKARHLCYAYRLFSDGSEYRINDDGEPSGSAGLPIYNQLLSAELTYILAAVVRYFGGTKLGMPGLIRAYKSAIASAIESVHIVEKVPMSLFECRVPYELMPHFLEGLKLAGAEVQGQEFSDMARIVFELPRDESFKLLEKIYARTWEQPPGMISSGKAAKALALQLLRTEG